MTENGIRVFFKDGSYEDFDPVEEHEYTFEGQDGFLDILDGKYRYDGCTVDRVVPCMVYAEDISEKYPTWLRDFSDPNDMVEKNDRLSDDS